MPWMSVYQDHQIVSESSILDVGVLAVARGLLRPLQHPIHLCEIEITEQRRDNPTLRNASFSVGLKHDLQQVHHVHIVHALCYVRQTAIVSNVVEVAAQINVNHACLFPASLLSCRLDPAE